MELHRRKHRPHVLMRDAGEGSFKVEEDHGGLKMGRRGKSRLKLSIEDSGDHAAAAKQSLLVKGNPAIKWGSICNRRAPARIRLSVLTMERGRVSPPE